MTGSFARDRPLRPLTTLRAGGSAEFFTIAKNSDQLAEIALYAQDAGLHTTVLGSGSNVLPSDDGVPGLTLLNLARSIDIGEDGQVRADCGASFQDVFLKTAQASLHGFEFAVGIPGTLGGALVSNAGAYRSNVSEFLTALEIVYEGKRQMVAPEFMQFSYRDSILRRDDPPPCAMLVAEFSLPSGDSKAIYDAAREHQRQRIGKQPAPASAGSFFKNVNDKTLAESLSDLPEGLRKAGVVPSGYLIESVGLQGFSYKGATIARRHANFILNTGGATATAIRDLAVHAKRLVSDKFGVELEEEVLFLGDWSRYEPVELVD